MSENDLNASLNDRHEGRPALSERDQQNVLAFEGLLNLIKAKSTEVALGYTNGLYITGRPGIGKTYTVTQHLKRMKANYTYVNCRVSPAGLHKKLMEHPENVFVLDDVTSLFDHKQGRQLLLAALGGEPGKPRRIEYVLKGKEAEPSFLFNGGVIAISNLSLGRDPVADAVASRVQTLDHEPSDGLVESFMRYLAVKGYRDMTSRQCLEVTEFLIVKSKSFAYRLDLRRQHHAYADFRVWASHKSEDIHWKTLVEASLHRPIEMDAIRTTTKKERVRLDREKVREAIALYKNRKQQIAHTGLSDSTFDRRWAEIKRESA